MPTSNRYFWKPTYIAQVEQLVYDKTHDSTNLRKLPANEIVAMALNEIAAEHKQGFFFHLLNREGWKSGGKIEEAALASRVIPQPG